VVFGILFGYEMYSQKVYEEEEYEEMWR